MKEKLLPNMKKRKTRFVSSIIMLLLSAIGCILVNIMFYNFTEDIIEERDKQLYSLAYSVDNTLTHEMKESRDELAYMIADADHQAVEQVYVRTGDVGELSEALSLTTLDTKENVAGILATLEDRVTLLSGKMKGREFHFMKDEDGDEFWVCYDEKEQYYPALHVPSHTEGLDYYILLDLENFYTNIVPEALTNDNWIVFYDKESGLATQNHDNQPSYLIMTQDEIRERDDGYTIIMENELKNQRGATTYHYPNYAGKNVDERIITLPSCETQNGIFAIGISRDSEDIYHGIRKRIYSVMLVTFGMILITGILIHLHMRGRYEELQMEQEMEHLEKENELTKKLTDIQIRNSVSQMQPHFMFNAMSSIRELIMENPEYASDMLYEFTTYLRSCINAMGSSKPVPFEEEIRNIEAYVKIEKMRYEDRLQIIWDIQDTDFEILPLSIQPLVENAIRHGIGKKRGRRGTVTIATRKTENAHVITVTDDGIGFDIEQTKQEVAEGKKQSAAIRNIRFRLEEAMNGKLTITSEVGKGTKVTVTLPDRDGSFPASFG